MRALRPGATWSAAEDAPRARWRYDASIVEQMTRSAAVRLPHLEPLRVTGRARTAALTVRARPLSRNRPVLSLFLVGIPRHLAVQRLPVLFVLRAELEAELHVGQELADRLEHRDDDEVH
eukprot:CAMPEP_0174827084 /NCGR_PEP_ID=MMETSP1114-20130205/478_1 /TAXON_ID=312471 /ORGANISM="Neobodo designis, Strain CCAP 1951/1" /LENGTH=119 /DNA_ID=CAMNT_0016060687 /DNA_START=263 /DNA_END=620 /DNA_ORIENTATION=-